MRLNPLAFGAMVSARALRQGAARIERRASLFARRVERRMTALVIARLSSSAIRQRWLGN